MTMQNEFELYMKMAYPQVTKGSPQWMEQELTWHSAAVIACDLATKGGLDSVKMTFNESYSYCDKATERLLENLGKASEGKENEIRENSVAIHDPENTFKIENLWMFISEDSRGEGIIAAPMATGHFMPLVASDEERVNSLRDIAKQISSHTKKNIKLIKFSQRTDLEQNI